jgi:AhpD family alkylhydroperoxidase
MSRPELSEILKVISAERGGVAEIHTAFKDFPQGLWAHYQFYKQIMLDEPLPLARTEREYLAMEVSQANTCPYCIAHHTEAYKNSGGTIAEIKKAALQDAAKILTLKPYAAAPVEDNFKRVGFSSAQWQHAVMVISYFNFANRCAHATGLQVEANFAETCK